MMKRPLGSTGEMLSIIGFGGILVAREPQKNADDYVAEAIDHGINYFDVAPSYMDAEDRLGPALKGKRGKIFLACKTEKRSKAEARTSLENSLQKLQTDHFDLFQLHAMTTLEEVAQVFGPDGAMETFVQAQQEGLIRYIGFSAHSEEAALALMDQFSFTSVLFPVNWVGLFNSGFGKAILQKAEEKGAARLALKAMARTTIKEGEARSYGKCWYHPVDDEELCKLALRYALSQPITAAIHPGEPKFFRWALQTAAAFTPVTEGEIAVLAAKARDEVPLFTVA